jgi:hypothetical protein
VVVERGAARPELCTPLFDEHAAREQLPRVGIERHAARSLGSLLVRDGRARDRLELGDGARLRIDVRAQRGLLVAQLADAALQVRNVALCALEVGRALCLDALHDSLLIREHLRAARDLALERADERRLRRAL